MEKSFSMLPHFSTQVFSLVGMPGTSFSANEAEAQAIGEQKFRNRVSHIMKGLLAYQESIHFMQTINLDFPGEDGYKAAFSTLDEHVARGEGGRERGALVESEDLAALVPKTTVKPFLDGKIFFVDEEEEFNPFPKVRL